MSGAHSRGPWAGSPVVTRIEDRNGAHICDVRWPIGAHYEAQIYANSLLFTAAADYFDAVELMKRDLVGAGGNRIEISVDAYNALVDAHVKAGGTI